MANGDLSTSIAPPVPDPTVLTTEQLLRTAQAERDYVDGRIDVLIERLSGMDRATQLLSDTVNKVPTEVQREVGNLRNVVDEKVASIDKQFSERDTRSEREARDNKLAVDAAFAAQEKQAVAQNDANTTAINKSEQATTETINKLAELFKTTTDALSDKIDDLKQRVQAIESAKQGVSDSQRANYQAREPVSAARSVIALWVTAALSFVAICTAIAVALTA
jgi:chromosome segregation ATPase